MRDCSFHVVIEKNIVQYLYWKCWKNLQQSRPFPDGFQNIKKCKYYISSDLTKFRTICAWNMLKSLDLNLEKRETAEMASCCHMTFHRAGRRHKGACSKLGIKKILCRLSAALERYVRTGGFAWLFDFDAFLWLLTFNPFIAFFPMVLLELVEIITCSFLSSKN